MHGGGNFPAMAIKPKKVSRRWASLQDAAIYMGVSVRTIRRWISEGQFKGHRMNDRVIRVDLNEIDDAMRPFGGAA